MLENLGSDTIKQIQKAFPEVEFTDARPEGPSDADVTTILVNEEYQFRIAQSEAGRDCIEFEERVLKALAGQLPLPIPEPLFTNPKNTQGEPAFLGWKILPGVPLSLRVHDSLVERDVFLRVVTQVANFMNAIHQLDPETLGLTLPRTETREEIERTYAEIRQLLVPAMSQQAVGWVTHLFESFLADEDHFRYQPVIRHGSLYGQNILVDPQTGQVTGILDFRFVALGDPAVDVATLGTISESFFSSLYEVAKDEVGPLMWRGQFYKSAFSLLPALEGARTGNQKIFESGIAPFAAGMSGTRVAPPGSTLG